VKNLWLAFVIDTTISMGPLVQDAVLAIRDTRDYFIEKGYGDRVFFAVVAYRNNHLVSPGLEYTTRIVSDFENDINRRAFSRSLSGVRVAKRSSHSFSEDSMAGLEEAIFGLSWSKDPQDLKVVFLITDAGPLPQSDPHRSTNHTPRSLAGQAKAYDINVVPVHLKTRSGRRNHQSAEEAYRILSGDGPDAYLDIEASSMAQSGEYLRRSLLALAASFQSEFSPSAANDAANLRPEASPEVRSRVTPEAMEDPAPRFTPEAMEDPAPRFTPEAMEDAAPRFTPEAMEDAGPLPEAAANAGNERVRGDGPDMGLGMAPGEKTGESDGEGDVLVAGLGRAAEGARSSIPGQDNVMAVPGIPPSREAIKALLSADPPAETQRLETALALLENTPGANDDVFLLIRVLAKRDPKYRLRLAGIFDPTVSGNKLGVRPNVKYAYDEYMASGQPEVPARVDRLIEWSKSEEAKGVDGYLEFLEAIR
jgi:hypothetical protein